MTKEELIHLIGIGFCQPKFYKPHVWRKAKRIMEWLCDHTQYVIRFDFGRGKGKYTTTIRYVLPTYDLLAEAYIQHHPM